MKRLVWVLFLIAVLSIACSAPLNEGRIIDKDHREGFTRMETVQRSRTVYHYRCKTVSRYDSVTKTNRSEQQCGSEPQTEWYSSYEPVYHPPYWRINLKFCETNDEGEEKCRTQWKSVKESLFDRAQIGNYYKDGELIPQ